MIQETTARKRSSGSSSRRKKSQRLKLNPPKPPRLILHPPKPPHQKPTKLKMVLRPPKSPSPEVDPSPSSWEETTLVGNGADASYDYGDICKVQAILKVFNGTLSATRKVESNEQKLNKTPLPSDVTKAETDAMTEDMRAKLEMNDVLQEALNCHHCEKTMRLKPEAMESDILHGIYRSSEDPPFLLSKPCDEDDVAPDEMPKAVSEPGYLHLATAAQQEQYLQRVEQFIARNRERKVFRNMREEVDQGYESEFAFYCVDYHIHQHFIHRRSILNYCRTDEEMDEVQAWKKELAKHAAQNNAQLASQSKEMQDESEFTVSTSSTTAPIQVARKANPGFFDPSSISTSFSGEESSSSRNTSIFSSSMAPSSPSTTASSPPKVGSFPNAPPPITPPWPKEQAAFSNQISLHRHLTNPHERAARVLKVREWYQKTMKKRAEQRRDGLIIANYEAAFALQKWQRGRGGPLAMQRQRSIDELLKEYNR
ncbi:hypothetical protein TCE0_018f05704 [Talaromyces pinophilus]|uniref:Uncharacterized protein n=1 Tax=Talaromyces pinophilus TaxID=128442 RepID=A0A510NWA3_TALPI|nr:hypothetical protein TCE0_018f05704 [Talaromyces pinophilus]